MENLEAGSVHSGDMTLSAPTEAGHDDNRNKLHYQPKDYFYDVNLNVQDFCKKQQVLVDYTTGIRLFYVRLWPTVKVKDENREVRVQFSPSTLTEPSSG